MIEQILTRRDLLQAMRKVQRNHGSAGVDHMPVTKLTELLSIDKEDLTAKVLSGSYLPQPILAVKIGFRKVKCQQTLRLIRKWLRSPIQINGRLVKRRKGIPQGSPLSPFWANIMLHELDRELERQGCRFVRYADDFSIYTESKAHARKVFEAVNLFLKNKLKLTINREKSGIRRPSNFKTLGFGFVPTFVKGEKGKYQLVVSDKSWAKFKQKLKAITRKTTPMSFDERIRELNEVQLGWVNNYRMANIQNKLGKLDSCLRNSSICMYKGSLIIYVLCTTVRVNYRKTGAAFAFFAKAVTGSMEFT